ncbi:BA14K family protein, partial [Azorhizobium caulinodans]
WGGPGWRGPGYYGPRYYNYNNNGAAVAAGVIGGLALGAAAASAANANQANQANAANWQAYCASKYRSFDPRTGTYLGYDGLRHPCQ